MDVCFVFDGILTYIFVFRNEMDRNINLISSAVAELCMSIEIDAAPLSIHHSPLKLMLGIMYYKYERMHVNRSKDKRVFANQTVLKISRIFCSINAKSSDCVLLSASE